jgi:hypothetical protein
LLAFLLLLAFLDVAGVLLLLTILHVARVSVVAGVLLMRTIWILLACRLLLAFLADSLLLLATTAQHCVLCSNS